MTPCAASWVQTALKCVRLLLAIACPGVPLACFDSRDRSERIDQDKCCPNLVLQIKVKTLEAAQIEKHIVLHLCMRHLSTSARVNHPTRASTARDRDGICQRGPYRGQIGVVSHIRYGIAAIELDCLALGFGAPPGGGAALLQHISVKSPLIGIEVSVGQKAEELETDHRVVHADVQVNGPQTLLPVSIAEGHKVDRDIADDILVGADLGHGQRCPIAGKVSMDMLTVDVTDVPDAAIGSEVVLWGTASNGSVLPVDEVARYCDTISYTLLTSVLPRAPRRYHGAHV